MEHTGERRYYVALNTHSKSSKSNESQAMITREDPNNLDTEEAFRS